MVVIIGPTANAPSGSIPGLATALFASPSSPCPSRVSQHSLLLLVDFVLVEFIPAFVAAPS
jgi:hypothetical protein